MHVFITGGSGLVGSEVIPLLVSAGHNVRALARSEKSSHAVSALGATPVLGSQTDVATLSSEAARSDAVIHLAFNHEAAFAGGMEQACEEDRAAISAICDALLSTGSSASSKIFVNTSGTLSNSRPDELCQKLVTPFSSRARSEQLTAEYATKGIKAYNIRLSPVTHGPSKEHPFIATQIAVAKQNKQAAYIAQGTNVWPAVHVKDAAALYVLALDSNSKIPSGANLHAVAEDIPTRKIAEFIGQKLNVPVKSLASEEAGAAGYGFVAMIMTMDNPTTHALTTKWTGWTPKEYGLIEELERDAWKQWSQ
ncbi:hypothetical protein HDU87_001126 [Geranomyces variabilis]|uniref:NAD-dependent epimerase/dehydratase domain-containing protein n=1 Tax=Geranomyces variabilis TaxID=109894 RepID=A0AAD5XSW0_9FUNG|nr:hypothetical protein HDU87_001126 [Geranomyces variabilis]